MRFIHAADIHLGYQQYGSRERFDDFSRAYLAICDQAIQRHVSFMILAGDLFEKRTVDPLAMRVAIEGLARLREAGIPVLAVEGNHERAHYRDQYSWVDFLDALGYVRLLNPRFDEGRMILDPHGGAGGAFVDLPGGVRVYGIKYYGAATGKVFRLFVDALERTDSTGVQYTVLTAHAGLEGQLPKYPGTLTTDDLGLLRGKVDYVALGHIHKPCAIDGWIHNPGSPETCTMDEVAWPERGYFVVDVNPGGDPVHQAVLTPVSRRPFHRMYLEVDGYGSPQAVYDAVAGLIAKHDAIVGRKDRPVIELILGGVLPFNRFDLDLEHIESMCEAAWRPLVTRVRNLSQPTDLAVDVDMEASRPELEHQIVRELLERDARFRPASEQWADVVLNVKRLTLDGAPPEMVIDALRQGRDELLGMKGAEA
ncbi:MAG: exonuclease SbcCD subunit D [Chloroflexi bacterium]|nr:exonuclease SbcCD subunit D [Chloroflexota bacterium]